jgi:hypothetical protein
MARESLLLTFLCCMAMGQTPAREAWERKLRPETLVRIESQAYGKTPDTLIDARAGQPVVDRKALGGRAIRKQVTIYFSPPGVPYSLDGPQMHLLLYLPAGKAKSPVFLGLNFNGNQSVGKDPGILTSDVWVKDPAGSGRLLKLPPDDATRGASAANWQVDKLIAAGYGLATIYFGDIEPDFEGGMRVGARSLFPDADRWSAVGVWAWGLSRALDYLRGDSGVDSAKIAAIGQGRLGNAALWAAAQDGRFALAAVSGYLPVDATDLPALIAPRPVYIAATASDPDADARAEFLSAVGAGRIYALYGEKGLGTDRMPPPSQPVMNDVGYHVRTGRRDVTEYDWDQYLAFAKMHWGEFK